jgi:predicted metal-dependent phosphoesterase TrpH
MQNKNQLYFDDLNNHDSNLRLASLRQLMGMVERGEIARPQSGIDVNNHIHTTYSFSPYSPAKAVWMAYQAGLTTAGIMDHDSISGALEFIEAGKIVRMATTIGVECRTDFSKTKLNGKRINNPDQISVAYVVLHGIPHTKIAVVQNFFLPYVQARNVRNRKMVERLNDIFRPFDVQLDFQKDVAAISCFDEGGSITERHILYTLAGKLIETYGKGELLLEFLQSKLRLNISSKLANYLLDPENEFYQYDLLNVLKSDLVSAFYIDATDECPDITKVIKLANDIGAISAYAYLGDIEGSVTGDKKNQKFEDDYLDLLFEVIHELGFKAVTYMPTRNTEKQLERLRSLCEKYGFFQISGEDINSPRQSFICNALKNDRFKNLIDATWALIGHELAATQDMSQGLFSEATIRKYPDLNERVQVYKEIGKKSSMV